MVATVYNPVLRKTVQLPVTFWGRPVSLSLAENVITFYCLPIKAQNPWFEKKNRLCQWICLYSFSSISWQCLHTKACARTCTLVHTHRHTYRRCTLISSHTEPRAVVEMPYLLFNSTPPSTMHAVLSTCNSFPVLVYLANFSLSVENQSIWCPLWEAFLP